MKKRVLSLMIAFSIYSFQLNAQSLRAGIVGEYSTSSIEISDIKNSAVSDIEGKNIHNLSAGIFARLKFSPFYLKPEVMYNFQEGKVTVTGTDGDNSETRIAAHRLMLPVIFGIKILGPLSVEGGPVYNYLFSVTDNFNDNTVRVKPNGWGYRIGAAAEVSRLNIGLSYQGIRNKASGITDLSTYQTPDQLILSLGINLGRMK